MTHDATERHTRVMYDFLTKEAKDGGDAPDNDEDKTTVGVNPEQAKKPEERGKGTIDAPWGEPDNTSRDPNQPEYFSDAATQGFIQSRQNMLDELFDSKKPATQAAQAIVSQELAHGASGNFESKAPLLEPKTASDRTLSELTRAILG